MLQKADTEARPLRGPLDQAGDIGDHKAAQAVNPHHPEVGHQGGEGIIGHLGLGGGYRPDKGGFAGIGQPQQTHIRQHFKLQAQVAGLPLATRRGLARGAVDARFVAGVAEPAEAALGHQQTLPLDGQVAQDLLGILVDHRGTDRHLENQVGATLARAVATPARLAILRAKTPLVAKIHQGIDTVIRLQEHAAAVAAIAAIGPPHGNVLFPAEAKTTITTLAGVDGDGGLINKFHGCILAEVSA